MQLIKEVDITKFEVYVHRVEIQASRSIKQQATRCQRDVCFKSFGGWFECRHPWYMGRKHDNKEWDINWEHLFPKVSRLIKIRRDIKEVDITECRVYMHGVEIRAWRSINQHATWRERDVCKRVVWIFWWLSFMTNTCDIWEGSMTTRSAIKSENTCPLRFRNRREGMSLRRLILRSLECTCTESKSELEDRSIEQRAANRAHGWPHSFHLI